MVLKQVMVGMACASYWRGAWYVLDDHLFPESTFQSAVASLGLGTAGLAVSQRASQRGVADAAAAAKKLPKLTVRRFAAVYFLSTSCVLVWRGAWLLCDVLYEEAALQYSLNYSLNHSSSKTAAESELEAPIIHATDPHHRTVSGVMSHALAMVGLLCFGRFASVLAPPAKASIVKDAAPLQLLYPKLRSEYMKARRFFQK